jgi:hypothetical protein
MSFVVGEDIMRKVEAVVRDSLKLLSRDFSLAEFDEAWIPQNRRVPVVRSESTARRRPPC